MTFIILHPECRLESTLRDTKISTHCLASMSLLGRVSMVDCAAALPALRWATYHFRVQLSEYYFIDRGRHENCIRFSGMTSRVRHSASWIPLVVTCLILGCYPTIARPTKDLSGVLKPRWSRHLHVRTRAPATLTARCRFWRVASRLVYSSTSVG